MSIIKATTLQCKVSKCWKSLQKTHRRKIRGVAGGAKIAAHSFAHDSRHNLFNHLPAKLTELLESTAVEVR